MRCWYFLLITFIGLCGRLSSQPLTRLSPDSLERGIAVRVMDFVRDSTGELPFEVVRTLHWASLDRTELSLRPWHWQWLRFELENESALDTLNALLLPPYAHWIAFWTQSNGVSREQRAGGFVNLRDRPYPALSTATWVQILPGSRMSCWLGLKTYESKQIDAPELWLKKPEIALDEWRKSRDGLVIHSGHYISIFVFLGIVFSIIYLTTRDRATGWYTLYVYGFLLLYLRKYDLSPGVPTYLANFRAWGLHIEIVLILIIFIAYTGFVRYFLDIKLKNSRLDRYLSIVMYLLAAGLLLELLVFAWAGIKTAYEIFTAIRIAGFWAFCGGLFMGIGKLRSKYAWFVLAGMSLLLAPALFTMMTQLVEGKSYDIINDVWRVHETEHVNLYMYSAKLGIVLELLCFAFAIGYKWKEEKELRYRDMMTFQRIESELQAQKEALTAEQTLNRLVVPTQKDNEPSELLSAASAAIEKNMDNPLFGVEELARAVHVSRAKLHRKLTEETGRSPSQLIQEQRLKKAVALLRSSRMSIAEIAQATGFSEPGYFSKVFKRELGMTPKEVREGA